MSELLSCRQSQHTSSGGNTASPFLFLPGLALPEKACDAWPSCNATIQLLTDVAETLGPDDD